MKKFLLFIIGLCLSFSVTGKAETVCQGTPVTGLNGHVYCYSTQTMSWYAALGWCAGQGRHLASINEACDYDGKEFGKSAEDCPNLKNTSSSRPTVWSSSPCMSKSGISSYTFAATGSWAGNCPYNARRRIANSYHAFCY